MSNLRYFAYGSNMHPAVLTNRRKVEPVYSKPCVAPGWYLNFHTKGLAYFEPSFASIGTFQLFIDQPEVHGVLHQITGEEFKRIRETEGGGGHDHIGYQPLPITVRLYDGTLVEAITLVEHDLIPKSTQKIIAPASYFKAQLYPSKRYMQLLLDGAALHNVDRNYCEFLASIPTYGPPTTIFDLSGRLFYLLIMGTVLSPILFPMALLKYFGIHPTRTMYVALHFGVGLAEFFYRNIFRHFLGNGGGELV